MLLVSGLRRWTTQIIICTLDNTGYCNKYSVVVVGDSEWTAHLSALAICYVRLVSSVIFIGHLNANKEDITCYLNVRSRRERASMLISLARLELQCDFLED